MRTRVLVVTMAAAGVLLAGCGGGADTTVTAAAPSTTGQLDVRAPVRATTPDASAPVSISVGGGTAKVQSVATDKGGTLYPPQNVSVVGWWVDSSLPGSGAGSVVIAGHIDDVEQGVGFAKRFSTLHPGDRVTLATADQHTVGYRVDRVVSIDKGRLPVADLNKQDGPETLIMVTCGGKFIGPPLGYQNNDLVYASRA